MPTSLLHSLCHIFQRYEVHENLDNTQLHRSSYMEHILFDFHLFLRLEVQTPDIQISAQATVWILIFLLNLFQNSSYGIPFPIIYIFYLYF